MSGTQRHPSPPTVIGNNSTQLGVVVDGTVSYDEDDAFSLGPSIRFSSNNHFNEDVSFQPHGGGGDARILRNGKVRRKLRWKPPVLRNKRRGRSSDGSVVSTLTSSSRSSSSSRSLFSQLSRKSQHSFHTFHSTETPKQTNKKNKPLVPHAISRPNYPDTFAQRGPFENKSSSPMIGSFRKRFSNPAHHPLLDSIAETPTMSSDNAKKQSVSPRLRASSSGASTDTPVSGATPAGNTSSDTERSVNSLTFFDPYGESMTTMPTGGTGSSSSSTPSPTSASITKAATPSLFDTTTSLFDKDDTDDDDEKNIAPLKLPVPPPPPPTKTKRTPLFRRKVRVSVTHNPPSSPAHPVPSSSGSSSDQQPGTDRSAASSKSSAVAPGTGSVDSNSAAEEDMFLPSLESDDYEADRRVAFRLESDFSPKTTSRAQQESLNISGVSASSMTTLTSTGQQQQQLLLLQAEKKKNLSSLKKRLYHQPADGYAGRSTATSAVAPSSGTATPPLKADKKGSPSRVLPENNLRAMHKMVTEHLIHGELEEATEVCEEILRGQQARFGSNHYRVGTAWHNLGIVHHKNEEFAKSVDALQSAIAVRKEALVPDHSDVAVSLTLLGFVHLEAEQHSEALVVLREALHIRRTQLGPRHYKIAKVLGHIGCALYSMGSLHESRDTFEQALHIQRGALSNTSSSTGPEAADIHSNSLLLSLASTLCNIGSIKLRWDDLEGASVSFEEALLLQQSVLDDDHPTVQGTLASLNFLDICKAKSTPSKPFLTGCSGIEIEGTSLSGGVGSHNVSCTPSPTSVVMDTLQSSQEWLTKLEIAVMDRGCSTSEVGQPSPDETFMSSNTDEESLRTGLFSI